MFPEVGLLEGDAVLLSGLIHQWVQGWTCCWDVGKQGLRRKRGTESVTWKGAFLLLSPSLYASYLLRAAQFHHAISASESANHRLSPQKPWGRMNLSLFNLLVLLHHPRNRKPANTAPLHRKPTRDVQNNRMMRSLQTHSKTDTFLTKTPSSEILFQGLGAAAWWQYASLLSFRRLRAQSLGHKILLLKNTGVKIFLRCLCKLKLLMPT